MADYQPSEVEWNTYGTMFAASRFGSRLLRVALWGIQTFMVVSCTSTFFKLWKERRQGYLRFILFSTVILAVTSIELGLDIWLVFRNLFKGGPSPRSYVEAFQADNVNESLRGPRIAAIALSDMTIVLADVLMATLAVFHRVDRVAMASCTSFSGMHWVFWTAYAALAEFSAISESLSVTFNVMVTGLILFELTSAYSFVSRAYPDRKRPSMYSTAAARVIESAAPLTFFGISYITMTAMTFYHRPEILPQRGTLFAIREVSATLYCSFSALSPQMIIFRVLNGQSWKNTHESRQVAEIHSQSLRFAIPDLTLADGTARNKARFLEEVPMRGLTVGM
ncbi:hypothetical protein BKA70DRAFT_1219467 [Coprinopsis sp. MPI-PUGE-AT-0042]|nr:hypothetical protein BKA70DRAFT_1219467 [Coprinopsis sp. MPI-PUGE-AT-0042]